MGMREISIFTKDILSLGDGMKKILREILLLICIASFFTTFYPRIALVTPAGVSKN